MKNLSLYVFFAINSLLINTEMHCQINATNNAAFQLMEGDLLFQDSDCGPFCEAIEKVTFGVYGSKFSHVGMVVFNSEKELVVIEAVTDGVVETSLETFFGRSFDDNQKSKVVVGRLKDDHRHLIPNATMYAKDKLGVSYDDVFNIDNDKYYCSELIYESFKVANEGDAIFQLQPMTYIDPDTNKTFPIWSAYFEDLGYDIPEGDPGLNPGGMSQSDYLEIVHFYGIPTGYNSELRLK